MNIITVSREFGSGGRELGKRLADALGFAYYDREIIAAVAQKLSMDESYLERAAERGVFAQVPLTFSRTLRQASAPAALSGSYLLAQQHKLIRSLAQQGNCVIVGRGADRVLAEYQPLTLFVYGSMPSKIARCRARANAQEQLTDREWERRIRQVDKARAQNYALLSATAWGNMHNYQLCINTTCTTPAALAPLLAAYAHAHFERNSV